jgi:hypothetical protein
MDIEELIAGLIRHEIERAEERGYRRAKDQAASRKEYEERLTETDRKLAFPCTFTFTQSHIGWLIAHHKSAYLSGGHWNVIVPEHIPTYRDISGGSVHRDGQPYHTLHATKGDD